MRLLITGGMGFVGTPMVDRLSRHHEVTVADRLDFDIPRETKDLLTSGKIRLIRGDIVTDTGLHREIAEGHFDAIVHLAALHYIPACEKDPCAAYRNNVLGSLALLQNLPHEGRLVNFSTAAVYKPDNRPHREETSPILPLDVYGWTKKHVEDLATYFAEKKNLGVINIRLFNAVGPGETNPHLLPAIIAQLQKGESTIELGNLYPQRDFIAIEDIAIATEGLLSAWPVRKGSMESFNVGSGISISVGDLFAKAIKYFGRNINLQSVPARQRSAERALLCADISKLQSVLPGFSPQHCDQWMPRLVREAALRIDARNV